MICDEVTCVSMLFPTGNRSRLAECEPQGSSSPCRFCSNVRRQSFSDTWEEEGKKKVLEILYYPETLLCASDIS